MANVRRIAICLFIFTAIEALAQGTGSPQPNTSTTNRTEIALADRSVTAALTNLLQALAASAQKQNPSAQSPLITLDPQLSASLSKWVDKQATTKSEKETWWEKTMPTFLATICGGLITAFVSLLGLKITTQRDVQRDKETTEREKSLAELRARLEKEKTEFANTLEKDMTEHRARIDRERDAANSSQQTKLEELRATLEIAQTVLKARQERLQKFHAPLRALTQQSRGVADKLYYHVYRLKMANKWPNATEPDSREYGYLTYDEAKAGQAATHPPPDDAKAKDRRLRVKENDKWITFRMLDYMPWLKNDRDCKVLIDQIIKIGAEMTNIISTHSGLAAEEKEQTSSMLGEYLAHYAVLQATYARPSDEPYAPESQKVGYYPRGLDKLIEESFARAQKAVEEFEQLTESIIERWVQTRASVAPASAVSAPPTSMPLVSTAS